MKIFALPSHATKTRTSGVDYARIISPMKNLDEYRGIDTFVYDPNIEEMHNDPLEWMGVAKKYDIFYFNYIHNPWGFAALGMMARKYGRKLIMDIDDSIWDVHDDNPSYKVWHRGSPALGNFTSICNEVDYITCTNEYLKHVIMSRTNKKADQIKVIPNYIDLKVYKHRSPFKDDGQIQLLYFGSSTHGYDLDNNNEFFKGVDRIMKEYPNVTLKVVAGTFFPKFANKWGQRYSSVDGHIDIYGWINTKFPTFMDEADILVTPLIIDVYNKSKSSIKWLEASSAKLPGVWQNIRQYAEVIDGTNGLLASTDSEWYKAIKRLIDNPDERRRMGESAFKDVSNKWTIGDHLSEYSDLFQEALEKST